MKNTWRATENAFKIQTTHIESVTHHQTSTTKYRSAPQTKKTDSWIGIIQYCEPQLRLEQWKLPVWLHLERWQLPSFTHHYHAKTEPRCQKGTKEIKRKPHREHKQRKNWKGTVFRAIRFDTGVVLEQIYSWIAERYTFHTCQRRKRWAQYFARRHKMQPQRHESCKNGTTGYVWVYACVCVVWGRGEAVCVCVRVYVWEGVCKCVNIYVDLLDFDHLL